MFNHISHTVNKSSGRQTPVDFLSSSKKGSKLQKLTTSQTSLLHITVMRSSQWFFVVSFHPISPELCLLFPKVLAGNYPCICALHQQPYHFMHNNTKKNPFHCLLSSVSPSFSSPVFELSLTHFLTWLAFSAEETALKSFPVTITNSGRKKRIYDSNHFFLLSFSGYECAILLGAH